MVLIHVATAGKVFQVVHNFAHDIVHCQRVDIDVFFPLCTQFVVGIYGVVGLLKKSLEIDLLLMREFLGTVIGDG